MLHAEETTLTFFVTFWLTFLKKPVHNVVGHFSCYSYGAL